MSAEDHKGKYIRNYGKAKSKRTTNIIAVPHLTMY